MTRLHTIVSVPKRTDYNLSGWQVKLCDPLVYTRAISERKKRYINSPSLLLLYFSEIIDTGTCTAPPLSTVVVAAASLSIIIIENYRTNLFRILCHLLGVPYSGAGD